MTYIRLDYSDLLLPALLVVMIGVCSLALPPRVGGQLAIATLPMGGHVAPGG